MKGKLVRLLMAAALAIGAFPIISTITAPPAEACTYFIRVWEDANATGDSRSWCNDSVVVIGVHDLNTVSHGPSGYCNSAAVARIGDDWDDCISSVTFYMPKTNCFVMFNDPYGEGPVVKARKGTGINYIISNMSQAGNDKATSWYFGTTSLGGDGDFCKLNGGPKAGTQWYVPDDQ